MTFTNSTTDHLGPDFQTLFEAVPSLYHALDSRLRIVAASDAYLSATLTHRNEVLGCGIFDVFPDNPDNLTPTGVSNLHASLLRVLPQKQPDVMAVQKYDIQRPLTQIWPSCLCLGTPTTPSFGMACWKPTLPFLRSHSRPIGSESRSEKPSLERGGWVKENSRPANDSPGPPTLRQN